MPVQLQPEELLLAQMVRVAIRDATQTRDERLRHEAAQWLWWVAPGIAQHAGVPAEEAGFLVDLVPYL
jgi:hypothetical protein